MLGKTIKGRYVIEELAAEGGMAGIYKATDLTLQRPVAIKVLRPHLCADQTFIDRFKHEAKDAACLAHPNIVAVYDTGQIDDSHFIVMEYVPGQTLKDLIEKSAPLPLNQAVDIASQVAFALEHAHRHGIVHRDVKPQNVMVTPDGIAKVMDFGIARTQDRPGLTQTGKILGTAHFISPEQASGRLADCRSDIYSFGVIFFEMLTGRLPFEGVDLVEVASKHISDPVPDPLSINPALPEGVRPVLLKLLAKDPAERFQNFEEVLQALAGWRDDIALENVVPAKPARRKTGWWTGRVVLAAAPLVLGGLLALSWFLLKPQLVPPSQKKQATAVTTVEPGIIKPVGVYAYDPFGNGGENSDDVGAVIDGNKETVWFTEGYDSPELGGLKEGVGVYLDLGRSLSLKRIRILAAASGWNGVIKGSNDQADWWELGSKTDIPADYTFRLKDGEFRYYLVWIKRLPAAREGQRHRLGIVDVSVWQD